MSHDVHIDELDPDRDKPAVYAWLRSFLRWHLTVWSRSAGLHWDEDEVDRHIDGHALVEREWGELEQGAGDPSQLVAVARARGRAVGLIHAQEREDRYLRIRMGVVSWIFVEPVSRGTGISTKLLAASRAWMRERGLRAAEVFVTADNQAAVTVYRRSGYELVDQRLLARLDGGDD